jgi:hypothetical protein
MVCRGCSGRNEPIMTHAEALSLKVRIEQKSRAISDRQLMNHDDSGLGVSPVSQS